jgi:hypothetical protein
MIKHILVFIVVAVVAYVVLWQSKPAIEAITTTEISTILTKPKQYDGRQVTVKGTVVRSAAIMVLAATFLSRAGPCCLW